MKHAKWSALLLLVLPVILADAVPPGWLKRPKGAPTIESFTATPSTIANGATSTLTPTVTGADSCSIDQGVGVIACAATANVSPTATTTYTLTAAWRAKVTTATATVTVLGVIPEDANTVCHATWNGSAVQDSRCAWGMTGTVPQVPANGLIPPGAGPFSSSNRYTLGTGNDVLDFAGDFSFCFVFIPAATDLSTGNARMFANANGITAGWAAYFVPSSSGVPQLSAFNGSVNGGTATITPVAGSVSVLCGGRSGSNLLVKHNLGALRTYAGGSIVPATSSVVGLGTNSGGANAIAGTLIEAWWSTTTPTDGLLTAKMNAAKAKMGISAW